MVLLSQGNTSLIQQAVVQANVFPLSFTSNLHHLERSQGNIVRLGKGHHVGDEHGRGRAEATHGQAALDGAGDARFQLKALLERELGTPGIIAPVTLLHQRGCCNIKTHVTRKGFAIELYLGALCYIEPQIYPLVYRKTRDQPMLMVNVRAQRADAIGAENMVLHY